MTTLPNKPPAAQLLARVIQERMDNINAASEKSIAQIKEMQRMVIDEYFHLLNATTQTADRDNNLLTHLSDIGRIISADIAKMKDGGGLGPIGKAIIQDIAKSPLINDGQK